MNNKYQLSEKENKKIFFENILPYYKLNSDFTPNENPKAYFTAGLPGAGKTNIVKQIQQTFSNILVIDADNLRTFHPYNKEISDTFGHKASNFTHKDATQWAKLLKEEALNNKCNCIIEGTMRNSNKTKRRIEEVINKGYNVEIIMVAVNKYESLLGVFNRYAEQYKSIGKRARFVEPKVIEDAYLSIQESANIIDNIKVDRFRIVGRNMEIVFDSLADTKGTAREKMKNFIDLKNWNQEKRDKLLNNFEKVIQKLKDYKAPQNIIDMAKDIQKDLILEIKNIKSKKSSLFPLRGSKKGLER